MPPYYRLQSNERSDRFYNHVIPMLSKAFNGWFEVNGDLLKRGWVLTKGTLAYFIANFTMIGCKEINIRCVGSLQHIQDALIRLGLQMCSPHVFRTLSGVTVIFETVKSIPRVQEIFPADYDRMKLQVPVDVGTELDNWNPNWHKEVKRNPKPERTGVFFDAERRKNGLEFIGKMLECGERAGIRDKMFLAFGNLLGYVIMGNFLPNDDDIDMNILADGIPQEQRHQYLMECKKAGLCENRMRGPAMLEDRYAWFSIGPKSPYTQHGVKSCNWFWFRHGGYWWHSKGAKWIGRKALSDQHPTAKGIPLSVFNGEFQEINFGGVRINAPKHIGKCLDAWYGSWLGERNCSSAINTVLVMPKPNRKTWYITNK